MITIFFLGIFAGIVSPLLRVRTKLGIVLAGGAAALTIFAAAGLMLQIHAKDSPLSRRIERSTFLCSPVRCRS